METGKRVKCFIGITVSVLMIVFGVCSAQSVWAADATADLSWNKNAEPDVQFYRLYTGATPEEVANKLNPGEDIVGPLSPEQVSDPVTASKTISVADDFEGIIYYGMAAVDTSGNESDIPIENVASKRFDFLAPSPVTGLSAQ